MNGPTEIIQHRHFLPVPGTQSILPRTGRTAAAAFFLLLLLPSGASAAPAEPPSGDDHDLSWSTIDGGGGTAADELFTLSGTIGQPDAAYSSGGTFGLTGGFWNPTIASGTPPTVAISPVSPSPRNTPVTTLTVTFSEPVLGLELSDFTLTRDGGPNLLTGAESLVTTDNIAWELGDLSGLTADTEGVYVFALDAALSGVTDNFGNPLANDAAVTWTLDLTAPSVSVTLTDTNPTSASQLTFVVEFNEPASFTDSDLSFTGSLGNLATASVSGSDASYTVTVTLSDPLAEGTVGLEIGTTTADGAGNPLAEPVTSELYVLDKTGPIAATPQDEGLSTTSPIVVFTWPASTDEHGIAGYYLKVGTSPGASDVFSGFVGNVLSWQVTGVEDEVLYATLRAMDTVGNVGPESAPSDGILVDAISIHAEPLLSGGNGDAVIDRNECLNLDVELTNVASTSLTSITATLESLTSGVTVSGAPVSYPDLAAMESAVGQEAFLLQTGADFRCGEPIALRLTVSTSESTFTETLVLETGRPGFARFDAPDMPVPISGAASSILPAAGEVEIPVAVWGVTGEVSGVTVSLHIQHPNPGDLTIQLVAPDGTTALLADRRGETDAYYGTDCTIETERVTFDDNASQHLTETSGPLTGSWRPEEPLLPLVLGKSGAAVNGIWRLRVMDHGSSESGTIECWSLGLTWSECLDGSCGGTEIAPAANLVLTKTHDNPPAYAGEPVNFTLVVENRGPEPATTVTLIDNVPDGANLNGLAATQGNWAIVGRTLILGAGTLEPDQSVTATVSLVFPTTGTYANAAFASAAEFDPDMADNASSVTVTVTDRPLADLRVSQSATPATARLTEPVTFTVTVTNDGPNDATSVTLTNTLPTNAALDPGSVILSQGTWEVGSGVLKVSFGALAFGDSATLTMTLTPQILLPLSNQATVAAIETDPEPASNTSVLAVPVETSMEVVIEDDFSTGSLDGTAGWVPFGFEIPGLAWTEYDQEAGAYKAHIAEHPTRLRVSGVRSIGDASVLPYAAVGPERIVRAKYYLYAGGQDRTIDIPAVRLRAAIRFAQTSMLEVYTHTSLDPGATPFSTELAPSTDPDRPSLYRVDFDPIDVPALIGNAATEGIMRAFEAYTTDISDQGYVAMTESVLGTYPAGALHPSAAQPLLVYAPSGGGAGNLSLTAGPGAALTSSTLRLSAVPGEPATEAPASDGFPSHTEGSFGVTFDTGSVSADALALLTREFDPGPETDRVRVEEGKQYVVRFHATSTVPSSDNAMLNFRTRSVKFSYTQRLIVGGAHAAGPDNNRIAAQTLPGQGTENPDREASDTTGGWYNVLIYTPLAPEIRPEFPAATPLSGRMPNLSSQPGPGDAGYSMRDLRVGADIVDTISQSPLRWREKGHMTIDRIEIRAFDAIPD